MWPDFFCLLGHLPEIFSCDNSVQWTLCSNFDFIFATSELIQFPARAKKLPPKKKPAEKMISGGKTEWGRKFIIKIFSYGTDMMKNIRFSR